MVASLANDSKIIDEYDNGYGYKRCAGGENVSDVLSCFERLLHMHNGVYCIPCSVCGAVTFIDVNMHKVSKARCRLNLTIVELRKRVADKLNIPCSVVQILQHGRLLTLAIRMFRF